MIPVKTSAGQQVLKDRSVNLTLRQRAALIVVDAKRTLAEVMQSSGATPQDVERLFELELVADAAIGIAPTEPAPLGPVPAPARRG